MARECQNYEEVVRWFTKAAEKEPELEPELTQSHMAQKPVLRGEVSARARLVSREETWASAGVQGAWVSGCGCEAD